MGTFNGLAATAAAEEREIIQFQFARSPPLVSIHLSLIAPVCKAVTRSLTRCLPAPKANSVSGNLVLAAADLHNFRWRVTSALVNRQVSVSLSLSNSHSTRCKLKGPPKRLSFSLSLFFKCIHLCAPLWITSDT